MNETNEKLFEEYNNFLKSKVKPTENFGFEVSQKSIHPYLKPHARDCVVWALRGGRRALFESFGLAKTSQQLEILRQIQLHKNGKQLIICPLGVKTQFQEFDGKEMDMDIRYVTNNEEIAQCDSPFMITNYERVRDGGIDPNQFNAVTLDESSVLRDFGSKTYQTFLPLFSKIPYRFVATATPSPNRLKELIHYAGFLGICDTGLVLTEYFRRNSQKAADLTIYPHKEAEFWTWVSTWSVFLEKPSDLGHSDEGYDLPSLEVMYHMVDSDHSTAGCDSWGQYQLIKDSALSLSGAAREKRDSIALRLNKAKEIVDSYPPETHWMIMYHLEDERHAVQKMFPDAKAVYGSLDLKTREKRIMDFQNGIDRLHSSKPDLTGVGSNFQYHCHDLIFLGINFSFHDIRQTIARLHRFMQRFPVRCHFIYTEAEKGVLASFKKKWKQHDEQYEKMREIVQKYGLKDNVKQKALVRTMNVTRKEIKGKRFTMVCNDNVFELANMPDECFHAHITSPAFGTQYEYSKSLNDFGHNSDNSEYFKQMDFLIPEMLRTLKPGRFALIHTKNRIRFGHVTGLGFPTVERFVDKTADAFEKHGFHFCGEIPITTDVVFENNQTNRLGWSEMSKDATKMGCGMPEYLLIFRKAQTDTTKGYADERVMKQKSLMVGYYCKSCKEYFEKFVGIVPTACEKCKGKLVHAYPRRQWQLDAHAHWEDNGNRLMTPDEVSKWEIKKIMAWWKKYDKSHVYDYQAHVELGRKLEEIGRLPSTFMLFKPNGKTEFLWDDIVRMRTLNGNQSMKNLAYHLCPLQINVADRCIVKATNIGELICDPFAGLGTVPYRAVTLGRHGYGIELAENYWADSISYCKAAEYKIDVPTLFDAINVTPGDFLVEENFNFEQTFEMDLLNGKKVVSANISEKELDEVDLNENELER